MLALLKSFSCKTSIKLFATIFAFTLIQSSAFATTSGGILCNALGFFTGNLGKTLALFALIALGVSFFLGKISWGTVLAVAFGIACIFGGSAIVNALSGTASGSGACSGVTTTTGNVNI
jgi:type IV secretory pathway VirB2 component (pilin)